MSHKEARKRIKQAERERSTWLDLAGLGLKSLPPEIGKLADLTILWLQNNQLTTLPSVITKITNLTELWLQNNQLTALPPEITKLSNLTRLYLGNNKLSLLLSDIGKLTNLTTLDLRNNQLTALPPEITKLTNLTTLDLANNQLTALPPDTGKLVKLRRLSLEKNLLTQLHRRVFDIDFIQIRWLSSGGNGIDLGNNPLKVPPIEVVKQGLGAVRAYYEEIRKEETIQLFEAKLLIVGQGKVGKTHLMKRLIHNKIISKTLRTEGIEINRWMIKTKQTDQFRVNFWDFGGQEIYHATHQFFLTKRSLYLFVWEARTDDDLLSFDYWLNTIKVLSDNSPVIVIQNKIDELKKTINQEGWKKRFPNIVDYHDVSATKRTGINNLKKMIIQNIETLPHIGDLLPKRWMDIRQELEALDENFIPYSRYQEICATYEMDDLQTDRLSEYYHDLGVFLHFKHNPILRNTIFLKPEWATNAVYKVTDNQRVKENYGKFHFNDLGAIWKDKKEFPPEKYFELLELMKSFELCFELPTRQEYIIAELLRANQPDFNWDYTQNLRFKYIYDFMPAGVMTRFIVRTHDMLKGNLYWKDGVVLTRENTNALIVKTDNRVIEVWIDGKDKKTLLSMIRRDMDYIDSSFSNLEVHEMVPCLCSECDGHSEPYFYRYQTLLKAREKGRSSIECQQNFEQVPIKQLLGEIGPKAPERRGREIKVFLASSGELKEERREVELFIGKENRSLRAQNIFLDLMIWEDLKLSFQGDKIQDYFNEKMLECDVVIFMFWKKVGDFTKEEFDVAYQHFKEGKKPWYLYVFFKMEIDSLKDIDKRILKIFEIRDEIAEAEQIYNEFTSNEHLVLQLKHQLELIIPEMVA